MSVNDAVLALTGATVVSLKVGRRDADTWSMPASILNDTARLSALRALSILDTPAEPVYDDIAMLAAASCGSAVAAVNFVDDERHWTKAIVGVDGGQGDNVPANLSLCAATICTDGGLLVVPDMTADEAWQSHPSVVDGPRLRFYAGAAIITDQQPVGVVCVFGNERRAISDSDQRALIALAAQASAQLELRRQNAGLQALALTDPLTGLPNRSLLFDRLEHELKCRRRNGDEVGVLFCDVDGFKLVNDKLGHEAGDHLLCDIAHGLRTACREVDTVVRLAGDEFVIVCPDLVCAKHLDSIVQRVAGMTYLRDSPDLCEPVRLSVGAVLAEDDETAADVLGRADAAMYRAKSDSQRPAATSSR